MVSEGGTANGPKVVAVVEEPETTCRCLMAAAQAAAVRACATVIALHIEVDPAQIRAAPEEVALQHLREPQEGSAHDRAMQIQRIFEFWTGTNPPVAAVLHKTVGTVDATLTKMAADADLLVICQPHNLDSADALHAAIFHSHKLVLFVPQGVTGDIRFSHIAIAWKDAPQAIKAVEQALPWLSAADHVSVLIGEESATPHSPERLERILDFNGIAFDVRRFTVARGDHAGTSLLGAAREARADALVMGAYRFGQVLERVFGGVTSAVLQRSEMPVFLAH
jgi:nucleotide-binding universal stress UspA family protein